MHEFGTRDPSFAGGFCGISLRCLDRGGHVAVYIDIQDDGSRCAPAQAQFSFATEPAAIDRFVQRLREIERDRSGSASLVCLTWPGIVSFHVPIVVSFALWNLDNDATAYLDSSCRAFGELHQSRTARPYQ
jgi:hypothetical protein